MTLIEREEREESRIFGLRRIANGQNHSGGNCARVALVVELLRADRSEVCSDACRGDFKRTVFIGSLRVSFPPYWRMFWSNASAF